MWDIKLEATTEQGIKPPNSQTQYSGYQREGGLGVVKGIGGHIYGDRDDLTLGGGHTMQCTEGVSSENYTMETYIILLTNATLKIN